MNIRFSHHFYLFAFITFFSFHLHATDEETPSDPVVLAIMEQNLSTLTWEDEDWSGQKFTEFIRNCWDFQKNLAPFKKRRVAFQILAHNSDFIRSPTPEILDKGTWEDLNLYRGSKNPRLYLAQQIDRTKTEFGKVTLYSMLSQATTSLQTLEKRQHLLRELIENDPLYEDLCELLKVLALNENILLSFWNHDPLNQTIERNFFKTFIPQINTSLNRSEVLLGLYGIYGHAIRTFWFGLGCLATVELPLYAAYYTFSRVVHPWIINASSRLMGIGNPITSFTSMIDNPVIHVASALAASTYCGLSIGTEFDWMYGNILCHLTLQKKLTEVADFMSALEEMNEYVQKNPVLADNLKGLPALNHLFTQTHEYGKDLVQLLQLLQYSTFHEKPSILSHPGHIVVAYRLMHELKKNFEKALCALGEIDAFVSMATLYREHQGKKTSYCFARFFNRTDPCIELTDFWNPFLDPEKVVANSLSMGTCHDSHIIIVTGPNAGGKSTLIKGVVVNLILAQTFGIACARSLVLTPFSKIATYLNIIDDIAGGNSLFKSQVLRVEKLLNEARALPLDQLWFIAFDEIFNGTSAREGQALSYSLIKDLATYPNNICVVATHYPQLKTLESVCPGIINYRVSAVIDTQGTIHYPFILERGTSSQHIAIDILRAEGFKSSILEEAAKLLTQEQDMARSSS